MIDESKIAELIANLKIENYHLTKDNESQKKVIDRLSRKIQRLKQEKLMYLGGFKAYIEMLTRINKAIEYIENMYGNEIEFNFKREQLLSILKGADTND